MTPIDKIRYELVTERNKRKAAEHELSKRISTDDLTALYPIIRASWKDGELDYALWKSYNLAIGNKL